MFLICQVAKDESIRWMIKCKCCCEKKKSQFKPVLGGLLVLGLNYSLSDQAGFQLS